MKRLLFLLLLPALCWHAAFCAKVRLSASNEAAITKDLGAYFANSAAVKSAFATAKRACSGYKSVLPSSTDEPVQTVFDAITKAKKDLVAGKHDSVCQFATNCRNALDNFNKVGDITSLKDVRKNCSTYSAAQNTQTNRPGCDKIKSSTLIKQLESDNSLKLLSDDIAQQWHLVVEQMRRLINSDPEIFGYSQQNVKKLLESLPSSPTQITWQYLLEEGKINTTYTFVAGCTDAIEEYHHSKPKNALDQYIDQLDGPYGCWVYGSKDANGVLTMEGLTLNGASILASVEDDLLGYKIAHVPDHQTCYNLWKYAGGVPDLGNYVLTNAHKDIPLGAVSTESSTKSPICTLDEKTGRYDCIPEKSTGCTSANNTSYSFRGGCDQSVKDFRLSQ